MLNTTSQIVAQSISSESIQVLESKNPKTPKRADCPTIHPRAIEGKEYRSRWQKPISQIDGATVPEALTRWGLELPYQQLRLEMQDGVLTEFIELDSYECAVNLFRRMPDRAGQFSVAIRDCYRRANRKSVVDQNAHAAQRNIMYIPELVEFTGSILPADHHEIASGQSRFGAAFAHGKYSTKEVQPRSDDSHQIKRLPILRGDRSSALFERKVTFLGLSPGDSNSPFRTVPRHLA